MKALSIKQPWLWAITDLDKRIENRTWAPIASVFEKRIAFHASRVADSAGYAAIAEIAGVVVPDNIPLGAIVATAKIIGYIDKNGAILSIYNSPCLGHLEDDKWYFGPFGWILEDIRKLESPIPCRGALGFWNAPTNIALDEEDQ